MEATNAERDAGLRRFKRYPAYKNSGVEWLGDIPAHWDVKPLKHLTTFSTGWTPQTGREDLYGGEHLWANIGDLGPKVLYTTEKTISEAAIQEARLRIVTAGSLLFSFKLSVGTVSIAGADMYTNEAIAAFASSHRVDTGFLYWAAPVLVPRNAQDNIYGAPLLNRERIANARVLSPPIEEQRAIAAFLDRETAMFDAMVAKKQRLIELLQEKRAALITSVVTKGLDASAPMKDSGVEWLGRIPAHWETKPLKHIASFINGFAFKPDEWGPDGTPIIRIENLNRGDTFNSTARDLPARYCASKGDLLFGWSGNRGTSFGPFIWWREGKHYVNQHIFRVVDFGVEKEWLYWALRGVTFYVEKQAHGIIGMVHITRGELGTIQIPVLPREEQQRIARSLDRENTRIDQVATRVGDAIDRLKELRTALISAAITGKIDVRDQAA
jgi:type I restriction enzyme, S subunit